MVIQSSSSGHLDLDNAPISPVSFCVNTIVLSSINELCVVLTIYTMERKHVEIECESRREQDVPYLPCTDWIGYSD